MMNHNISVRFWLITSFSQIKHFMSNEDDVKISFKHFFSENTYVLVQISAGTGRGDFNNSTNVAHTQIQLMMML